MGRDLIPTPFASGENPLLGTVSLSAPTLAALETVTGVTQFAEDAVAASGALGVIALAVRKDAEGTNVNNDGDYATLLVDATGRLRVVTSPTRGTLVDRSGALAAGAVAEDAIAAATGRNYLLLVNPLLAAEQGVLVAEDLWYNLTGTATVGSPSIKLAPGQSFLMDGSGFVSTQALSVIAATIAHKWTAREA